MFRAVPKPTPSHSKAKIAPRSYATAPRRSFYETRPGHLINLQHVEHIRCYEYSIEFEGNRKSRILERVKFPEKGDCRLHFQTIKRALVDPELAKEQEVRRSTTPPCEESNYVLKPAGR